jgi:hypothetical protein
VPGLACMHVCLCLRVHVSRARQPAPICERAGGYSMYLYVYIKIWTRTHMYAVERPVERVKMVTRVTTHEQPIVQNVRQPVQIVIEV